MVGANMSARQQIEDAIFLSALDLPEPAARREFLDRACAGDASLRTTVEAMLADQETAEKFFAKGEATFQSVTVDLATGVSADSAIRNAPIADDQIGKRIGPYKILQRIGEGGCGAVYLAEQEQPIHRRVAVKIIKLGMDTKRVIARFEAERQALALMDHPNIARVLDAGATETGRPYFVMELVHGVKITDYCDQNNLGTRQRLELFIQVCHAIQHAHQKGVIHRDIKPSNILVTLHDGVPAPKVIDFGIAKAIEGRLTEQTPFTACEQIVGTPAYMSPEQAEMSGLDVDTRSDIYSLGVLLYELLTGRTPFDGKELIKGGLDKLRRTLREEEPQRPSGILTTLHGTELTATAAHRHAEAPKLISLLKGDLDWIVMKALEKDRARRYETANGLAVDAQRYLNNEPVVARPPSRLYRLQKLVRRNRMVFAAGTVVALALIVGLGTSLWMFFKAEEARANEAALRQQAEAREKLTEAVMLVNQGNYDDAARLIEAMKTPPTRPSLDGVAALRSVGEWLAIQGRWREAANQFSALMEIDKLDLWGPVTLDYQSCGVVLVESGNLAGYERFRDEAVARFITETNGDAAGRILKTCLLPPVHESTLAQLRPLGSLVERWTEAQPPATRAGWAAIPIALWKYRVGEFAQAEEYCRYGLNPADISPQAPTIHLILAMACYQNGQAREAREHLAQGRALVEAKFKQGLDRGTPGIGMWYDWVFARVLLREADGLINQGGSAVK
jgi:eukaryotic-like serine/threonine-protein kinase